MICQPIERSNQKQKKARAVDNILSYFVDLMSKGDFKERRKHLTSHMLLEIWSEQEGRCKISGLRMTHVPGVENVFNASPDRIKPKSKGGTYARENVQLVCKLFQMMKMDIPAQVLQDAILSAAEYIKMHRDTAEPMSSARIRLPCLGSGPV
jgi:hypothetical protein